MKINSSVYNLLINQGAHMEQKIRAKDTALVVILILLIIDFLTLNHNLYIYAGIITILALVFDLPFIYLSRIWFGFSKIVGHISNFIILTIVYCFLLTPIGMLYRRVKNNVLFLKNKENSLFANRNHKFQSTDLKRPY